MAVFESTGKMYEVLGELFETLFSNATVRDSFLKEGIDIRFVMHEPSGEIWLTKDGEVICGNPGDSRKETISMELSGDTAHKFWLKQITLPVALAKGLIKAKGPLPKVLKLLPLLKPAYEAYPDIAKKHGLEIGG